MKVCYFDEYDNLIHASTATQVPCKGDSVILGEQFFVNSVSWDVLEDTVYIILSETMPKTSSSVDNHYDDRSIRQMVNQAGKLADAAFSESKKMKSQMGSLNERISSLDRALRK